ncbi:MAG TPA: M3 family metallopeptidase [Nevskiales bacterium]|nr:M3 family metallopeptidase [Nevskiales bacterium]
MKPNTLTLAGAGLALALAPALPALASRPTLTLYDAPSLTRACEQVLEATRVRAEALAQLPMDAVDVDSVLGVWNDQSRLAEDVLGPASLLAYVHPDKTVRDAGEACILKATETQTAIFQNEALYQRVQAVSPRDAVDARYRLDLIEAFEDTGVTLPPEPRAQAKAIMERLTALDQEFDRNLREVKTTLTFSPAEQRGLPASYLERVGRDKGGNITVGFDYPDYFPFMAQAEDGAARQRYYTGFLSRGGERNLDILDEIVTLRRQLAGLYGFRSYADFATRRRMVGNTRTVSDFLDEVDDVVRAVEARDVATLAQLKQIYLGSPEAQRLEPWDKEFYLERLRKLRYDIDQEKLRRHFPTEATVQWALNLAGELYGLRFEPVRLAVWHDEVRYYDVKDAGSGRFIGGLYLDLYPRPGKYGHAAAFGVRGSSTLAARTPISVLVTNFDRQGLTHTEVETLLHEFGHAMHGILSQTRYVDLAGTNVELDFVEAPSQMFEEWARRPESLRRLLAVCKDCPPLDDELLRRLDAARKLGSGLHYGRQLLYARYDMALAGEKPAPALKTWVEMERDTPLGHAEGTRFPATFSHIAGGYAAGYYGYMWSEAVALDMLSAFGDNLMNPAVGQRFRDTILARGGEVKAEQMVREFLGRPSNRAAFFAEIRGERKP